MRINSPIHFGPFSIDFFSNSSTVIEYLERYFSGYESEQAPDVTIEILLSDELSLPVVTSHRINIALTAGEGHFTIGSDLIRGKFDFAQKECCIIVHRDFFCLPLVEVFHAFLQRFYHTLCNYLLVRSYFIHGCGVIKQSTGFLFIGPHQSGKTTIGKLSNSMIIHDDQIILMLDEKGLAIDSPPLPAKFRNRPKKPWHINKIYFIMQNTEFLVERLDAGLALQSLYNELVLPLTLTAFDEGKARTLKARICIEILRRVPVYALHFDKNENIWDSLMTMQSD